MSMPDLIAKGEQQTDAGVLEMVMEGLFMQDQLG
ncbi:hypothetical protein A2U01_0104544, partial [Trifolium medium]|nr:hypothetical protein [Trifolium medium]